ncbi:MAG: peptidase T [Bacteroidales bacterium]|nr:peptidase T [Bacteroidales bacterium]MBN2818161.1 peptidase T [Bacteroidales bacterium]
MEKLIERFLKYVKIETSSDENSKDCPSTPMQMDFQKMLVEELKEIGLEEIDLDEKGYLMATLPANTDKLVPVIGFVAHVDTSPDFSAKKVNPQIQVYKGKSLVLNEKKNITLGAREFPSLVNYLNEELITTDGTTLLGADDKAGIAEIITAMEMLKQNPEIKHGRIRICFTPDEEIGRGADHFDVNKFGANFAYTLDGGQIGELEFENFNAASAKITIQGLNVHPGTAKNRMKNSMRIGMELNGMLPANERPEFTDDYEGFYHLTEFTGTVDYTKMSYIIRDHDKEKFSQKKELMIKIVDHLNIKYGTGTVKLIMFDQYYNMREKIEPVMHIVNLAQKAMEQVGVKPKIKPIRGGTDGSRLSYMGLPCPNIFAGGHNFHSRYEYIPTNSMKKAVDVIMKIAELNAQ